MTDAGEAARRFLDPDDMRRVSREEHEVIARALLSSSKRIEELEKALGDARRFAGFTMNVAPKWADDMWAELGPLAREFLAKYPTLSPSNGGGDTT